MVEELRKFKNKAGHHNVPSCYSDYSKYGRWVNKQQGRRLKVSKDRASKLDSIGFTWDLNPDSRWKIMYEELRKFKDMAGHCNVPLSYSDSPKLGSWVIRQKVQR